jgi:hypothetical protein
VYDPVMESTVKVTDVVNDWKRNKKERDEYHAKLLDLKNVLKSKLHEKLYWLIYNVDGIVDDDIEKYYRLLGLGIEFDKKKKYDAWANVFISDKYFAKAKRSIAFEVIDANHSCSEIKVRVALA